MLSGIWGLIIKNAREEEINLNSIYSFSNTVVIEPKHFLNKIDKNSSIYYNVSGTLNAPTETKGSILSVFSQKIKRFIKKKIKLFKIRTRSKIGLLGINEISMEK